MWLLQSKLEGTSKYFLWHLLEPLHLRCRAVARDIGGSDPERMSPTRTAEYVLAAFPAGSSGVKVQVIDDQDKIKKDYPLAAAVNRAANGKTDPLDF